MRSYAKFQLDQQTRFCAIPEKLMGGASTLPLCWRGLNVKWLEPQFENITYFRRFSRNETLLFRLLRKKITV